jgi:NAD(P)-dependent dehydrogenase (short-subunit alcohol dehydrogenase family)
MTYELSGFEGKVAVVTGAGRMRSIGRSVAVQLAAAGCDVVITGTGRPMDRYPADEKAAGWRDIGSVADEIRDLGRRALPVVSDVSDEDSVASLADQVISEFGRVDILVNNAGAARGEDRCAVIELPSAVWQNVIDVNLTGSFLMSKAFGRHMVEAGRGGSIVNISSIAGKRLGPFTAAYAASKAAIHALTACMAQEVGQAQVRVNAICPGFIDTSRMDAFGRGAEWDRTIQERIPLGRAGSTEDIANAVLYLCADQGSWVTGQSWNVDGGSVVQH